jgi:hypothetical protein
MTIDVLRIPPGLQIVPRAESDDLEAKRAVSQKWIDEQKERRRLQRLRDLADRAERARDFFGDNVALLSAYREGVR